MKKEKMCAIAEDFKHGKNFECGNYCAIEQDVLIGNNVKLGHHVVLKSGTRFGSNIDFADYCCTTGICYVGNGVNVRTRSCISKSVIVEDRAFIGAGVMTSHTKNVYHHRPKMPKRQHITHIGMGAIIGSSTNIRAGITIGNNVVVGYASNVVKDLIEEGIYIGNPARKIAELKTDLRVEPPDGWKLYTFPKVMLEKYLPYYRGKNE